MKRVLIAFTLLFIVVQLFPVGMPGSTGHNEFDAPPQVKSILETSCYDCHSNSVKWPWYAEVAPVSWWLAGHVEEGREHLNFDRWDDYSEEDKKEMLEEIVEEVEEGEMPLPSYLLTHSAARLDSKEISVLREWVAEASKMPAD